MQKEPKNDDATEVVEKDVVEDDETLAGFDPADTIIMSDTDFPDGDEDDSTELNVEELVAKAEAEQRNDVARRKEIRRRLEELAEKKSFEDTYAIDFDSDSDSDSD